jgi:dihydrofolate reductase
MRKVIVTENVTLDGVMQAPGRPDEDTRDGFAHGGWALPFDDAVKAEEMGRGMAGPGALLLGRRTYDDFYQVWPQRRDNLFTGFLNRVPKYVASRSSTEALHWQNSTLVPGDATRGVAELKRQPGPDLTVLGSGELVAALTGAALVDVFVLLIHPQVLGSGRRLSPDGTLPARLDLASNVATSTGVIIVTYHVRSS